jgi:hypothetical protein
VNGAVSAYARFAKKRGVYERKVEALEPLRMESNARWDVFVVKRAKLTAAQMREAENIIAALGLGKVAAGRK